MCHAENDKFRISPTCMTGLQWVFVSPKTLWQMDVFSHLWCLSTSSNLTSGGKSGMCHAVYLPHHKFQLCAMLGNCFNKTAKVWCWATLDHDPTDRAPSHESSHQARRFPGSMQPLVFKSTVSSAHYWGTILAYANIVCMVMCSVTTLLYSVVPSF